MAERLTKKDKPILKNQLEDNMSVNKNTAIKRLWKYENVMEKYGIENVEELDMKLANFDNFMKGNKFETIEDLQNALNGKFIEVFDEKNKIWQDMVKNLTKTEKDRNTWKRACELACENMKLPVDILIGNKEFNECHSIVDYFYQQAKKEDEHNE